jgi:hypothetical protein
MKREATRRVRNKKDERRMEQENEKWEEDLRQKGTKWDAEVREWESEQNVSTTEDDRLFLPLLYLGIRKSMVSVTRDRDRS